MGHKDSKNICFLNLIYINNNIQKLSSLQKIRSNPNRIENKCSKQWYK